MSVERVSVSGSVMVVFVGRWFARGRVVQGVARRGCSRAVLFSAFHRTDTNPVQEYSKRIRASESDAEANPSESRRSTCPYIIT